MGLLEERPEKQSFLLQNIKSNLPLLESLLKEVESHWGYEDLVYRYYDQSFRVYHAQERSKEIYKALEMISPHTPKRICDEKFNNLIKKGASGIKWVPEHNQRWEEVCEPMVNAFLHAKYFLEMAVKYGKKYDEAPNVMDSGWAALLELYNIR